ncbi:hypothetical protein HYV81_01150 [Candidatus Woesearchaeota archaeon]|nr:hypothetical protein [Candidatus Woesearchaeota archaeon]
MGETEKISKKFSSAQKSGISDKSSFRLVFGDSPIVKVIDFFLDNREFDYSLTDIAKNADIGWSTLHGFWNNIVKLGIVTKTRKIGRAELYKLNLNSPLVKKLIDLDNDISKKMMNEEINKQKLRAPA